MSDTEKIIEISLAKIENSKAKKKGTGKLHKNLLVNSLLNKVSRETETGKARIQPLMNYRESRLIIDLDTEDYDMDKVPVKDRNFSQQQQRITPSPLSKKQSSVVTKLHTRSIGKVNALSRTVSNHDESIEMKENIGHEDKSLACSCDSIKLVYNNCSSYESSSLKRSKKRLHSIEILESDCPRKRLRSLWTPNIDQKVQEPNFSVTSLSSLFGNLVAHSESDKSLDLRNKFVSAMVAC